MSKIVHLRAEQDKIESLPKAEIAWSESLLQNLGLRGEKYNPDSLMGRKGFGIYKKMKDDEQIKAVTKFKRDAITSRDYFFIYNSRTSLSEEEQQKRITLFEVILKRMSGSFLDSLNGIMTAMDFGFSVTEKIFEQFEHNGLTWWGIKALKLRPFDTFYIKTDVHGNVLEVIQRLDGKEQRIDLKKFIWFVINPDNDDHYGGSELKEAFDAWYNKSQITRFWNIWLERHASGWTTIMPSEGSENFNTASAEWDSLLDATHNKSAASVIAFPRRVDIQQVFPTNNVAFREAINHYDLSIAKALLVPNLLGISSQTSTGSFAQAETQLEAFLWTLDADADRLEECINEKLLCELGDVNFGDGEYPIFKFKPVSESKKMQIINLWKDLSGTGAVSRTDADENHIRDLMDFPQVEQDTVAKLDRDQTATLMDILSKYKTGNLELEAAVQIITLVLPMREDEAEELLAMVEVREVTPPIGIPSVDKEETPPSNDESPSTTPQSDPNASPQPDDISDEELRRKKEEDYGETPSARGRTAIEQSASKMVQAMFKQAFANAQKRVDFQIIDKTSEDIIDEETTAFSSAFAKELLRIKALLEETKLGTDENRNVEEINNLKINRTRIRKVVENSLRRSWDLGKKTAESELQRTSLAAKKVNFQRLEDRAADFFNARSFQIAGKFSDDALSIIKNILFNGIKGSKATDELVREIYETFTRKGSLSLEDAEDALGEAINVTDINGNTKNIDPTARLRTTIRTTSFEAINEARHDFYTDPELDGFVAAFEYSAILDSRVTQICRHLDGRIYSSDNELWNRYRPPNHFNCRSLLIPVLEIDDFVITEELPTLEPQDGFG
jgi:SPP1 gp7 family putative phage head morphogenesis protein